MATLPFADDVADGALEGERAGIVGHHAAHARHDLVGRVGGKRKRLVEGNVLAHGCEQMPIGPLLVNGFPNLIQV